MSRKKPYDQKAKQPTFNIVGFVASLADIGIAFPQRLEARTLIRHALALHTFTAREEVITCKKQYRKKKYQKIETGKLIY